MKHFCLEKSHFIKLALFNKSAGFIDMVRYKLVYSLVTDANGADTDSILAAQKDQNASFAKINAFITNILANTLVLQDGEEVEHIMLVLGDYQNNIMVLPECHESLIVSALHSKFNAIAGENTFVELVELVNLDDDLSYKLYTDEGEIDYPDLPEQSEWQGEFSYWDQPWWFRYDTCTMDRTAKNQEEYDNWKNAANEAGLFDQVDLFTEVERQLELLYGDDPHFNPAKSGQVVEVDFANKVNGSWKPEII